MTSQKATRKAVKSVALATLIISISRLALAADTTINTAQTTTRGPTPPTVELDGNDTLTIGPAGSVTVMGDSTHGIFTTGNSNTITNNGSISTDGLSSNGIRAEGSSNTITNSGSIRGIFAGGTSNTITNIRGIYALGNSNTITNNGSISTDGPANGIRAEGSSNTITNSGSIISAGILNISGIRAIGNFNTITNSGSIISNGINSPIGIRASGDSNTITNSGSISTGGGNDYGIAAQGSSNTITNSGLITTTAAEPQTIGIYTQGVSNTTTNSGSIISAGQLQSIGIYAVGASNTITNSGSIRSISAESVLHTTRPVDNRSSAGIYAVGDSNTMTNSGSILGINSYAIAFLGSGNKFNTLNDLFIGGRMAIGTDGVVNFTTGANHSKLYTFEATNSVLAAINSTGPVPLFINAATLQTATYDPTIFASSSDALADMTSTISSLTPGRFNGSDKDHPLWLRGFGMAASYDGSDATLERSYRYSGVAIGYDFKRSKDLSLGVLGGYGQSSQRANSVWTQSFNNTSNDGFLGLYGQKRWKKVAFDFALYGGIQSFQLQRYVNDNLANLGSSSVGNSSANASYQGLWLAPEAGITYNAGEVNGWSILPTARLRYAQQWMGGYTETGGGEANATVNGRSVAIGQMFVGLGTRKTIKTPIGKGTKMVLDGQVGYLYRGVVGDDSVNVTMIGQSLSLPTESSSRNAVAISAGVSLDLSRAVALKIRGDLAAGSGLQYGTGGWVGLNVKF